MPARTHHRSALGRLDQLLVGWLRAALRWGVVGLVLSIASAWIDAGLLRPSWTTQLLAPQGTATQSSVTYHTLSGLPWSTTVGDHLKTYSYEPFGLPFPSAIVLYETHLTSDRARLLRQSLALGVPIDGYRAPGNQVPRALPLLPWWGIVPNILLWGALAYACRASWMKLRSRVRIARRQCPKCGYPTPAPRSSAPAPVCPECGSPVLSRE